MPVRILLASASPRRRELLSQLGVDFEVLKPEVDETPRAGESAEALTARLALAKARAGQAAVPGSGLKPLPQRTGGSGFSRDHGRDPDTAPIVVGSDTEVELDGRIYGKPQDEAAGVEMLRSLAGRAHTVWSAVAAVQGEREAVRVSRSLVRFRAISPAEARAYWASGEPRDKAGGYAIQGLGAVFIEHLDGSYSGVMGLPVFETAALLNEFGVALPRRR